MMPRAEPPAANSLADRTVRDFGDQWAEWDESDGYYASLELLQDVFGPLLSVEDLRGLRAADLGSGTGRIARMLLEAGASHVTAVEPSQGVALLRRNLAGYGDRARVLHATADRLPAGTDLDLVISYGMLQFIPDPLPTLAAAHAALRPGGRVVLWVYGREGTAAYRVLLGALRGATTRLPHAALSALCDLLNGLLGLYLWLCRYLPLPLRRYARSTLARLDTQTRKLVIYDQLNPTYVHFYTRSELEALSLRAGFVNPRLHHRGGYSWTVIAERQL